jgi:1,4-dihydroxy-2-naphthoate polyprenyltransferase
MTQTIRLLIRVSRPHFLLGAILVYALGVGVAKYLGVQVNWGLYLVGQVLVTTTQLGTHFLNEYHDGPADLDNPNRTPFSGGSGAVGPGKLSRSTVLLAALGCFAVTAAFTVLLISYMKLTPAILVVMILSFLGAFFYSSPPFKLSSSGYGELSTSILVAFMVPAFAFLLQAGDLHRLVAMTTFPLTAVHLAMMLAFELPDYGNDLRHEKRTLMVRMGWKNGMVLHNVLIISAYLLLGLAVTLGMPMMIALPAFFTFPLGLLQIWQMRRVAAGARPNWMAITLTPVVLFVAMTYLLAFAYWTR